MVCTAYDIHLSGCHLTPCVSDFHTIIGVQKTHSLSYAALLLALHDLSPLRQQCTLHPREACLTHRLDHQAGHAAPHHQHNGPRPADLLRGIIAIVAVRSPSELSVDLRKRGSCESECV
jgi:hypothetical protein